MIDGQDLFKEADDIKSYKKNRDKFLEKINKSKKATKTYTINDLRKMEIKTATVQGNRVYYEKIILGI